MSRCHSVGYFSSYDRGLECLLEMWPVIRKQVPDATLIIAYGWNGFDEVHRGNPERMKWKWGMIRKLYDLKDQGVSELGRLSHAELHKVMKNTKVWAYPTEFTEINCITALKTQEAGCIPVVTRVAALNETVKSGTRLGVQDIYSNKAAQKDFIDAVVFRLCKDVEGTQGKPVPGVGWNEIATQWAAVCD